MRNSTKSMLGASLGLFVALGGAISGPNAVRGATTFVVNRIGDAADLNLTNTKCDTSTASGNQCTLRAAIQEANDTPGADTINFNITSTSKVISPATALPPITEAVTINGYSQSGASANTLAAGNNAVLKIVLDGINAGALSDGLRLEGANIVVRGLVIQRFDGNGVSIAGHDNIIGGNFIGTTAAGTTARPNGFGVEVTGPDNLIGGGAPASRNLISGNEEDGINIVDPAAADNRVTGNFIGTKKGGAAALGNGGAGVRVFLAPRAIIGGNATTLANVISGNGQSGVDVQDADEVINRTEISGNLIGTDVTGTIDLGNDGPGVQVAADDVTVGGDSATKRNIISGNEQNGIGVINSEEVVIQGNYIGTNKQGAAALPNSFNGISLGQSSQAMIGGDQAGERNVISGNGQAGLILFGCTGTNSVKGNLIGTKADGTGDLGNVRQGIHISGCSNLTVGGSGAAANLISGNDHVGITMLGASTDNFILGNVIKANIKGGVIVSAGEVQIGPGNLIFANGAVGVKVAGDSNVKVTMNQIYGNTTLGIDLFGGTEDGFGTTANDLDDPDTGPNNLQNFPVLATAAHASNGVTTVSGSLNSTASDSFVIELFVAVADASGHGEGQIFLATQNISTNSGGDKSFVFQLGNLSPGMTLTATATRVGGGRTSEFSANVTVVSAP